MRRFLQGLGLGLLVAALVMGIGTRGDGSMADESVVEKARELGMVFPQGTDAPREDMEDDEAGETDVQTDADDAATGGAVGAGVGGTGDGKAGKDSDVTPAPTNSPKPTKKPSRTRKPKATDDGSEKPEESTDPDATPTPKKKDLPDGTVVEFRVRRGLLSSTVAKELYEAGVIDDLWEFDHYIEEHGLGHNIIVGTYELTVGDSYEKIAKIITHT